jgi:hypothetical protein
MPDRVSKRRLRRRPQGAVLPSRGVRCAAHSLQALGPNPMSWQAPAKTPVDNTAGLVWLGRNPPLAGRALRPHLLLIDRRVPDCLCARPIGPVNRQCPLLPKLLPNSVARRGTETDGERYDTQEVLINRDVLGSTGMGRDGGDRISSAVRSTTLPPLR